MLFFVAPLTADATNHEKTAKVQSNQALMIQALGEDAPNPSHSAWIKAGRAYDTLKGMGPNSMTYIEFLNSSHLWG